MSKKLFNAPDVKLAIVAVSRDCFPESLSVNRRKALVEAYTKKYRHQGCRLQRSLRLPRQLRT